MFITFKVKILNCGRNTRIKPSGYEPVSVDIAEFSEIVWCVVRVSLSLKRVILCLC